VAGKKRKTQEKKVGESKKDKPPCGGLREEGPEKGLKTVTEENTPKTKR